MRRLLVLVVALVLLAGPAAAKPLRASAKVQPATGLARPGLKEVAQILVSTAEDSSRDWRGQYRCIEYGVEHDADENRGYTGGIIGLTSRTHDMLAVVRRTTRPSGGPRTTSAMRGTSSRRWRSHAETGFTTWGGSPTTTPRSCTASTACVRSAAMPAPTPRPPADGGNGATYLRAFLKSRIASMQREQAHQDVSRITDAQQVSLDGGNLRLRLPLRWHVYGDVHGLTRAELHRYRTTGHF